MGNKKKREEKRRGKKAREHIKFEEHSGEDGVAEEILFTYARIYQTIQETLQSFINFPLIPKFMLKMY